MAGYRALADLVVVFHAAYVIFVVLGFAAIVIGIAMRREWVRNFTFRMAHLGAIALVCVEAITGTMCPLTTLEDSLRARAGEAGYPGDFIGYWAHELIFYNAPSWVFTTIYLIFGVMVALTFVIAPPRLRSRRE
jgi:uncharacterized protein DUF2784